MLDVDSLKVVLDIGLGGLSLLLWVRQGKVNTAQVDIDKKQTASIDNLSELVKEHDARISTLERARVRRRREKS